MTLEINPQVIEDIINEIAGRSGEELKTLGDDAALLLKKIALDYIAVVQQYIQLIQKVEHDALLLKQYRDAIGYSKNRKNPEIVAKYTQYKSQIQNYDLQNLGLDGFYKASIKFNEDILSVINNHDTKITIIIPDADGDPIVLDVPLAEMFKEGSGISVYTDITSKKVPALAGRLRFNVKQIKERFAEAIRKDSIIGSQSLQGLNKTYSTALTTFDKYRPYVFWKRTDESQWHKMKLSGGKGDISEAYAYFFYTGGHENPNTLFLDHLYSNLDYFYREGLTKVDSVSGLYTSDISTTEYDYAVKSIDASLPGFSQMIKLAIDILNGKVKSATELQLISLKKQYKDPINQKGQKGLRNKVQNVVQEELIKYGLT